MIIACIGFFFSSIKKIDKNGLNGIVTQGIDPGMPLGKKHFQII